MYFKLNLSTCEITEVPKQQAEAAMKNFGYKTETINRLSREATAFYTGDAFYSSYRPRLEEEIRENRSTAPMPYGTCETPNFCQLSQSF